jgi:hypothetical protein
VQEVATFVVKLAKRKKEVGGKVQNREKYHKKLSPMYHPIYKSEIPAQLLWAACQE